MNFRWESKDGLAFAVGHSELYFKMSVTYRTFYCVTALFSRQAQMCAAVRTSAVYLGFVKSYPVDLPLQKLRDLFGVNCKFPFHT